MNESCIWRLFFAPFLCIVLWQSITCMQTFLAAPEVVDLAYVFQSKVQFPALTFCPIIMAENKDLEQKPLAFDLAIHMKCGFTEPYHGWMEKSDFEDCQRNQVLQHSLATFEDFGFKEIIIVTMDGEKIEESPQSDSWIWTESIFLQYGKCFTFNMKPDILEKGVHYIGIKQELKTTNLILHTKGSLADPEGSIGALLLPVKAGQHSSHYIEHESVNLISYGQQPCIDHDDNYDKYKCMLDETDKTSMELFDCASPFGNFTNVTCKDNDTAYQAFEFFHKKTYDYLTCPNPCESLWIKVKSSSVNKEKQNDTSVWLAFESFIKRSQSRYSYGLINLTAEIGSHIGLFLGLSFMNVPAFLARFIQRLRE